MKELLFFLRKPSNIVSATRGGMAIVFGILIILHVEIPFWMKLCILLWIYPISDDIDGRLARKFHDCNRFGEIFDIVNDKISDNMFAFAVFVTQPQYAWVIFIFMVFKISIETLIWRTIGNQKHVGKEGQAIIKKYSKVHAFLARGWPLDLWVWSKAFFFIPVLIGYPIPFYEYVFAAIVLARSSIAVEMLIWHAKDVKAELDRTS